MRLIDADDIIQKHGDDITNWDKPCAVFISSIENAPTVDAAPVVHAKWIDAREYCGDYMCSNCDALYGTNKFKYCPNCGAKMDLEKNEE